MPRRGRPRTPPTPPRPHPAMPWPATLPAATAAVTAGSAAMVAAGAAALAALLLGPPAPYGRHGVGSRSAGWGPPVSARLAWATQEAPSLLAPVAFAAVAGLSKSVRPRWGSHFGAPTPSPPPSLSAALAGAHPLQLALLGAFCAHYLWRALFFPLLLRGGKPTPAAVWAMAAAFCTCNGVLQGAGIALLPPPRSPLPARVHAGLALWLAGWALNLWSDRVVRERGVGGWSGQGRAAPPPTPPFPLRLSCAGCASRARRATASPPPSAPLPSSRAPTTSGRWWNGRALPWPRGLRPRPRLRSSPPPTSSRAPWPTGGGTCPRLRGTLAGGKRCCRGCCDQRVEREHERPHRGAPHPLPLRPFIRPPRWVRGATARARGRKRGRRAVAGTRIGAAAAPRGAARPLRPLAPPPSADASRRGSRARPPGPDRGEAVRRAAAAPAPPRRPRAATHPSLPFLLSPVKVKAAELRGKDKAELMDQVRGEREEGAVIGRRARRRRGRPPPTPPAPAVDYHASPSVSRRRGRRRADCAPHPDRRPAAHPPPPPLLPSLNR